jgi:hypothetical protein
LTTAEIEFLAAEKAYRTLVPRYASDLTNAQLRYVKAAKALAREAVGPVVRPPVATTT